MAAAAELELALLLPVVAGSVLASESWQVPLLSFHQLLRPRPRQTQVLPPFPQPAQQQLQQPEFLTAQRQTQDQQVRLSLQQHRLQPVRLSLQTIRQAPAQQAKASPPTARQPFFHVPDRRPANRSAAPASASRLAPLLLIILTPAALPCSPSLCP